MKPFKKSYPKVERFNTPYPKSVLKLYPVLTKYPWNGRIIGDGYGTPMGTPILSPTPGIVTFAGTDTTGSKTVDYTYEGMRVRMGHLSRIDVKKGQKLGWQTQIGLSGKTGMATHPHLYIQVNKGKTAINPDIVIKMEPVTLCRMGTKIFDPQGKHLSPAELKERFGTNYKVFQIPNVCKGIEDKLTLAKQELKVRITERDTERKAKESYATRLAQVEKDNIALNTKVTYYGGRIDDLLKKMGQDEKDTKRLMENSAKALVEKGKRIQELESLVNSLTADAELGAGVRTIYQATKNALERILGRIKHD